MKSLKKEYEQEKKIAEAIDQLDGQRAGLRSLAKEFEDTAFEAAKMGQDEYANELLETAAEIEEFAIDLDFVSLQVTQTVKIAGAMSNLRLLPDVVKICSKILCKTPNFDKLGKAMGKVSTKSKGALADLRKFREKSRKNPTDTYSKLFGRDVNEDPKHKQLVEQKKKALELRMAQVATAPAPTDIKTTVNTKDVADIDAIAQMLDDEKRK
jgi:hypothetical protein